MRTYIRISLAIITLALTPFVSAQSGDSSSKISATLSSGASDDAAFANYEKVTHGVKPPKATYSPDPEYPKIPVDAEPRGVVVMLIGINTKGHVELVHVLRTSNEAFEDSAVNTVKTWKFSPAKRYGKPVPVQITVEMHFQK
jgi:TonB family protein